MMRIPQKYRIALLLPGLILLVVLFVLPMLKIVISSFQINELGGSPHGLTLNNFLTVITDSYYAEGLWTTFWISSAVVLVGIIIGFPLATVFSRSNGLGRFALTLVLFLPLLSSPSVTSYGWLILLGRSGAVNTVAEWLGLISEPISFLYHPLGLIIAHEQWVLPFIVLPIAATLSDIDPKLFKAASSLGAGSIRRFFRVTLPLSSSGIIGGAVVGYALTMSSYVTPAVIGGGRVRVTPITIYDQFITLFNAPLGSALAVILFIIVVVPVAMFARGNVLGGRS